MSGITANDVNAPFYRHGDKALVVSGQDRFILQCSAGFWGLPLKTKVSRIFENLVTDWKYNGGQMQPSGPKQGCANGQGFPAAPLMTCVVMCTSFKL